MRSAVRHRLQPLKSTRTQKHKLTFPWKWLENKKNDPFPHFQDSSKSSTRQRRLECEYNQRFNWQKDCFQDTEKNTNSQPWIKPQPTQSSASPNSAKSMVRRKTPNLTNQELLQRIIGRSAQTHTDAKATQGEAHLRDHERVGGRGEGGRVGERLRNEVQG